MSIGRQFFVATALLLVSAAAAAHEVRPAYLEISETGEAEYAVLWKVPARGEYTLSLTPVFPEGCELIGPARVVHAGGAMVRHSTIECAGSLVGATIGVEGLTATMTDVLVRFAHEDGNVQTARLQPSEPMFVVTAAPSWHDVAMSYLLLGIEHILLGIDHLLFVLGLLLIVRGKWLLVKTVTAFTVAHSITLAMATLGVVHAPQAPVEAVIALSILFLASELARRHEGETGLTETYPWIVAFIFGLLHGFGFAGALSEIGLPQNEIPLALLFFNVGVEVGQLVFIAAVLTLGWLLRRLFTIPAWVPRAAAYLIGSLAAYWVIQRVAVIVGVA